MQTRRAHSHTTHIATCCAQKKEEKKVRKSAGVERLMEVHANGETLQSIKTLANCINNSKHKSVTERAANVLLC